jgi:hypothetical protein
MHEKVKIVTIVNISEIASSKSENVYPYFRDSNHNPSVQAAHGHMLFWLCGNRNLQHHVSSVVMFVILN